MFRPAILLVAVAAVFVLFLALSQDAAAQDSNAHRRSMGNLDPNPNRRSMGNLRPQTQPTPHRQGPGQSPGTTTYVIPNPYYPAWRYIPQPVYPVYPSYGYGYTPGYYYPPSYYPPGYYPYGYRPGYVVPRYPRRF
jgi:hypothetical protein